ncbi:hydroxymethylglutaryl-CoA lyase [Alkalicaulis satelles]|uniref:Hydroxymethylglutaryl-CoA lyase n=1 Tax=Alkalicaulis satelles TaxID=2609175 RepID=A0A5M6ZKV4_9PROT|nr:hydroxymethylglutaryl-CoA lyase [Alkalicaulis satelles]KAA5805449.1 hydroxymethylglutaryl-CoA lyase [Alkalicaulis satelles]
MTQTGQASAPERVEIVEVGPRDGLQNDPTLIDTGVKLEFIHRLIEAGVKRMEAASFVNPKLVPAMADGDAVMAGVPRDRGVTYIGLALNERGLRRAIDAGCDEINFVMVASEGFGRANQNATPEDTADLLDRVAILAHDARVPLSATISVAFGDPFDGEVDVNRVAELARRAAAAGVSEIALGDTIGAASPWDVRRAVEAVRAAAPDPRLRLHFHNTRNTALANIYAALEAGVTIIDASAGGIGGCPFAPRATGNVATEDVVYMLSRGGVETGIDLDRMIETARWLETVALRHPVASMLSKAGGFPPRAS